MGAVKKLSFFILGILLAINVSAKEPLRTQDSIFVEGGKVVETGIVSDPNGEVFLEFIQDTRVVNDSDRTSFQGEILPPSIIPLPVKPPRPRMQEVVTFELLADTADKMLFTDKFSLLHGPTIARMELNDPDNFQRTSIVKLLAPLKDQYNLLALWEYRGDAKGWARLGGSAEASSDPDVLVFSSAIRNTGIFSIFEEDPPPSYIPPFPIDEIEFVEEAPDFEPTETEDVFLENEVGLDANLFPEPQAPDNIPPITVEGEDTIPPIAVNGDEIQNPQEEPDVLVEDPEPQNEIVPVPENAQLPQTGPEDEEPTGNAFPFGIIFALLIVGLSAFFAFRKKEYS